MHSIPSSLLRQAMIEQVAASLREDIGSGDITAALIPPDQTVTGQVITRDPMVMAGLAWVDEVFRQVDPALTITWNVHDGERVDPQKDPVLFRFQGNARSLLTAERSALNWLQTLAGVATRCRAYVDRVAHTATTLLDTRKTVPGLRLAQKYAIQCGGGANHRLGLYDAFLIKENHITACGSISAAVAQAHEIAPGRPVEVEVESLVEFEEALQARADIVMLDEFPLETMREAVEKNQGQAKLEASGGINEQTLVPIAETGVDYISLGTLTKDLRAIDLSMRFTERSG
ncbi:carboxylating nicotinate-nucleotide diphosphorylase [Marinobacteraceae bacterium S3BR75-40.1]